jgi:hypothetical protein
MKKTEIEHMWKVASNDPHHDFNWHDPVVVAFAQLVAQKEREECAKLCEKMWHRWLDSPEENEPNKPDAEDCYRAIRARGQA